MTDSGRRASPAIVLTVFWGFVAVNYELGGWAQVRLFCVVVTVLCLLVLARVRVSRRAIAAALEASAAGERERAAVELGRAGRLLWPWSRTTQDR